MRLSHWVAGDACAKNCELVTAVQTLLSYAYFSKHVADDSSFGCDGGPIECRMDIHVRRVAIKHGRSDGYLTLTAAR